MNTTPHPNPLSRVLEVALMLCIGLILLTPLTLAALRTVAPQWLDYDWLRNRTLQGEQLVTEPVPLSVSSVLSAKYQEGLANDFNRLFAGKEALIRWTNELYYSVFRTTASKSSTLAIGKDGWLFEEAYLTEYYLARPPRSEFEPLIADLKKVQDAYRKRNIAFVLLITPSKVSMMPEMVLHKWKSRYDPSPRAYDHLVQLLKENDMPYIDGCQITRELKTKKLPPFAKGGTHWTTRAALKTSLAVMDELSRQGMPLKPVEVMQKTTEDPLKVMNAPDADILKLMNLALPRSYTCGVGRIKRPLSPLPSAERPMLAVVGGSFMHMTVAHLGDSQQFSAVNFHYYYKLIKFIITDSPTQVISDPGVPDFESEFANADAILLEINEANLVPANHLRAFVADSVKHLERLMNTETVKQ